MKQTHHIGYVQTPSVKNLSNVKNALVENGLVSLTTPNEMLPDAIEKGIKEIKPPVDLGVVYEGKYRVRYYDIDGTILKIEYVEEGGKLTPPKSTPNYDTENLIFDDWNYDIENYIVDRPVDVGALYDTKEEATYLFCKFTTATGLSPTLNFNFQIITEQSLIDWGDGTVNTSKTHTYSKEGYYLIKIYTAISLSTSSSKYLLGSKAYNSALLKLYCSSKVMCRQSSYSFKECQSLEIVSFPTNQEPTKSYNFYLCTELKHINIPNTFDQIQEYEFNACYKLKSISLTDNITRINTYAFSSCYSLNDIIITDSVSSIARYAFQSVYIVNFLFLFKTVAGIAATTYPSFNVYAAASIIWVRDSILDKINSDSSWTSYKKYIRPLSWYPSLTDPNAE